MEKSSRLGKMLCLYMASENLSCRALAKEFKVSIATISRIRQGEQVETKTLIKLLQWMFDSEDGASEILKRE